MRKGNKIVTIKMSACQDGQVIAEFLKRKSKYSFVSADGAEKINPGELIFSFFLF